MGSHHPSEAMFSPVPLHVVMLPRIPFKASEVCVELMHSNDDADWLEWMFYSTMVYEVAGTVEFRMPALGEHMSYQRIPHAAVTAAQLQHRTVYVVPPHDRPRTFLLHPELECPLLRASAYSPQGQDMLEYSQDRWRIENGAWAALDYEARFEEGDAEEAALRAAHANWNTSILNGDEWE
jgi:hypothetical protein